jgi:hypothetical protein
MCHSWTVYTHTRYFSHVFRCFFFNLLSWRSLNRPYSHTCPALFWVRTTIYSSGRIYIYIYIYILVQEGEGMRLVQFPSSYKKGGWSQLSETSEVKWRKLLKSYTHTLTLTLTQKRTEDTVAVGFSLHLFLYKHTRLNAREVRYIYIYIYKHTHTYSRPPQPHTAKTALRSPAFHSNCRAVALSLPPERSAQQQLPSGGLTRKL